MSPSTVLSRMLARGTAVVAAAGLVLVGAVVPLPAASAASTTLTITPLGWNVVGLDSNSPTSTTGPARYAIGARVCNTGAAAATAVTPTWSWLSTNSRITLLGLAAKTAQDIAAGTCRPWWWTVDVQRVAASQNTARSFSITATSTNASSVTTPANREIYVEKLISQARNNVTGSSGPTSVYVGGTYTWTFTYDTGTFNQVMAGAFLDPSIFEISSVSQNYSTGGANDQFYKDACGWINDTTSANYRSCTTNAKVGGTITSTVTATVTGTGTSTIAPLVLDFSGSSYHYNSDYATSVYALTVTATNPPAPSAVADSASTGIGTQVDVDVLANDTAGAGTLSAGSLSVTAAPAHGTASVVGGKVRYTPAIGYAGTDTLTYRVCNSFGACSTAVVTITVSGPPTAVPDSATAPTAVATLVDVLANDSSPTDLPLTISSVGTPSHGTATIVSGQVRYTSVAGYQGPDAFSYTISNGTRTASSTVSLTVVNSAPAAQDDSATTATATPVDIAVRSNDTDPNGDILVVTSVTQPSHGTVSINLDGTVRYSPTGAYKGLDQFTYTVSDGSGGTSAATVTVSVANAAPVAAADAASTSGGTPVTVPVLGNDSDPNSDPLTPTVATAPAHGTAAVNPDGTVTYVPAVGYRGTDTFTYTVSDGTASSAPATVTITVGNTAPMAQDDSATTHGAVTVPVLGNDTDANGDGLTITSAGPAAHGTVTVDPGGTVTYTPDAGYAGPDSFSYTVSDGHGGMATATVAITVTNAAPTPFDDAATLVHGPGASATVDVLGNDADPDGDPLTLVAAGPASHGSVAIVAGKVVYTPTPGYVGDDVIAYSVSDGHGGTASAQLTVHVTNTAPVAAADSAATPTSTAVDIAVLGNDGDADSDVVTVASVGTASHGTVAVNPDGTVTYTPVAGYRGTDSFTYTVTDGVTTSAPATVTVTVLDAPPVAGDDIASTSSGTPVTIDVLGNDSDLNGDALSVSAASSTPHGTLAVNPDGSITYTPAAGFAGVDTFAYTVSDGVGGVASATVRVFVGGASPVAVDDAATTAHGVAVVVPVLGNDTDANGDTLAVDAVGIPAHGTAFVLADRVVYTPDAGFFGTDTFTYVVSDGNGGFDSATVTVTVTNVAPTTVDDETTVVHGGVAAYDVVANDSDADGDPVSLVSVTDGAHGTATVVAGQVRYTPDAGFVGDDTVTYSVSDGVGGTATGVLTIHVTNTAPTAVDDTDTVISGGTNTVAVLGNDSDPESDTLTVTSATAPAHGTATIVPGGVSYTGDAGYDGTDTFTYTISDGHGGTSTATVTVTVLPSSSSVDTLTATVAPVCLTDVPYVDYTLDLQTSGARTVDGVLAAAGTYSLTWRDATGAVVATWTGLADSGRLLWPGATVDAGGTGTDWPGWVRSGGAWVRGEDGFERTMEGSNLEFSLGTVVDEVTVVYPARTTACVAAPRLKAARDSASTPAGQPVVIVIHSNDTGTDDGAKTTISGAPSHGTVVINPDGTATYTPDAGFTGTDTFTYTVTNADGQTSTTTVTVVVSAGGTVENLDDEHPQTGADVGGLLGIGLLLLVVGAVLRRTAED